jgi:hypothetical protein
MAPPADNPIRAARVAAGHGNVSAAARSLGMAPSNLIRLELGGRSGTWATVRRVIVGLNLGLEYFFPESLILAAADRVRRRDRKGPKP